MLLRINDHDFEFVGVEPYIRVDGSRTFLNAWRTACAHDGCRASWEFKTPASDTPSAYPPGGLRHASKLFTRLFCAEHKPKVKRARPKRGPAVPRVSDADVATMREIARSMRAEGFPVGIISRGLSVQYPLSFRTIEEILGGRRR